jgi:hypothetical protein
MVFSILFEKVALDFIDAWNENDFEKMKSFFFQTIVFHSPTIGKFYPENKENTIVGNEGVIAFMKKFVMQASDFQFDKSATEFSKEGRTITMFGAFQNSGTQIKARYLLNEYGKFISVDVEYL